MGETEDELVDNPVDAHRPADQLQVRVFGVVEDEVVAVKVGQ